jgi:hypothetical protein
MIYVDELRATRKQVGPFLPGTEWCHLTTDGPLEELHQFAEEIGMQRAWFQDKRVPHYDLRKPGRDAALQKGAIFMSAREQYKNGIGRS